MGDDVVDQLRAAKPDPLALSKERARAALSASLFDVPLAPITLSRYVILHQLGRGGMGVVYSAYDPELDRKVAIKVLRTERQSQAAHVRLLREAQALARLSHPHVVAVHDVGELDGRVFIVMEFVRGQTLRQWVDDTEPGWRAIVDAYVQAGRGMAAAHEAGLVHRDFKPDNALMGEDGRVRVVDFGLVRGRAAKLDETAEPADEPARPAHRPESHAPARGMESTLPGDAALSSRPDSGKLDTPLTAADTIMGTPAYMAPEQFDRPDVGPETDQFSFCVSLHEALYGERPFKGASLAELMAAVRAGVVPEPARSSPAPRYIHDALLRGLAVDPRARHPSMHALLDALLDDPARRRRRLLVYAGVSAVLLAALVLALRPGPSPQKTCQGAADELAQVWNAPLESAVQAAILGSGRDYAAEVWPLVSARLEQYGERWMVMHRDACLAHERGHQSNELLDRRMACLQQRKHALAGAARVLSEIRPEALDKAVEVAEKLPDIDRCGDIEALLSDVPPPEDPATAARVTELRADLAHAQALEHAGRMDEALAQLDALDAAAEPLAHEPLLAELALARGRVLTQTGQQKQAVAPLRHAIEIAMSTGMDVLAVEAIARIIYAQGTDQGHSESLETYLFMAEAMSRRVTDVFPRALLLNYAGTFYMATDDIARGRQYFERALALRESATGAMDAELEYIYINLAIGAVENDRRESLFTTAIQRFERAFGPAHPTTLTARATHAFFVRDLARAYQIAVDSCSRYERYHGHALVRIAWCLDHVGLLEIERGQTARAARVFAHMAELLEHTDVPALVERRNRALGYARLYSGDARGALEPLRANLAGFGPIDELPHWQRRRLADTWLLLGMSEERLGRTAEARRYAELTLPVYEELASGSPTIIYQRQLARTRALLARSLWLMASEMSASDAARERERARALWRQAEAWYADTPGNDVLLRESRAWREQHQATDQGAAR